MSWSLLKFLSDENGQKCFSDLNYVIPSCCEEVAQSWYKQTPPANCPKALENILKDSAKVDYTYF